MQLEDDLRPELHSAGAVSPGCLEESRAGQAVVHSIELGVIKEIKEIPTKFERSALSDRKVLEDAHVKVRGPRISKRIAS